MTDLPTFLVLGLGNGAVFAAIGLALVMTFKSSGVVNFATGTIALYSAYTYALLRDGKLMVPIPGLPRTVDIGGPMAVVPAMAFTLAIAGLLGIILYALIFRPMRGSTVAAKAVVSIGLMIVLQALIAQRVGTQAVVVEPIFRAGTLSVGSGEVPTDRLWLAAVIVLLAALVAVGYRFTRFGVATEAAAESEKGAFVTGLSPDRIAYCNWALSSAVAGLAGILIAPLVPLNPVAYTLFIVPALAATLVGNFSSISLTVMAGLVVGALQSEAINLQASYDWLPKAGLAEAIPLLLILVFLVVRGRPLPDRGSVVRHTMGRVPRPDHLLLPAIIGFVVTGGALVATTGSYRSAIIVSIIFAIIGLSQVVVTGFAGQVSLAQLTMAGVGAFSVSVLNNHLGVPFPFAPVIAGLVALVIGVIVGLPALRVRGLPLTVVTLALAVFLDAFWFRNPSLNGGLAGSPVNTPKLLGIDLGIGRGEGYPRIAFGLMCLLVLTFVALSIAWIRRANLGSAMLAVRANERSAAAAGISVSGTKIAAFAIASFLAGIAGSLLAYQQTVAVADSYSVFGGIALFAIIYVAGITSVGGGILAGLLAPGGVLYLLTDRFLHLGDYYTLFSGVLLIVTVMVNQDGIAGRLPRIPWPSLGRLRRSATVVDVAPFATASSGPSTGNVAVQVSATEPVLSVRDVSVRYGSVQAVDSVSFDVYAGEIVGLIGPNGAGKTTLVDALTGFVDSSGVVELRGTALGGKAPHRRSRAGLGRSFQDAELYDDLTVTENVSIGAAGGRAGNSIGVNVVQILDLLGIADIADEPVVSVSQGQRQLVAVARVLAAKPVVALLDEPAAGLDTNESRWLGQKLTSAKAAGIAMLLIDHDIELVLDICDRVVVLDLGSVIATGPPEAIRANDEVIRAYLGVPAGTDDDDTQTAVVVHGPEVLS